MKILNELIHEAYDIFSIYTVGNKIEVCTQCCISKKYQEILLNTPLRELSDKAIYEYLDSAECLTNEEDAINQIRYLLPKILEFFVADEELRCLTECTLDKLHCKNKYWQVHEIQFMQRFASTYFQYLINDDLEVDLASFLVVFDLAELDVSDLLLKIWQNNAHKKNALDSFIYLMDYDICRDTNKYINPSATINLQDKIGKWALAQLDHFSKFYKGDVSYPNTKVKRYFYQ